MTLHRDGPNAIFAQNLRSLCETRGTQASVTRALGLTKVQMQRYLRGAAFPKPDVLLRICGYFGTDARIFTTPLRMLAALPQQGVALTPANRGFLEAMPYAVQGEDLFTASDDLPDGFYTTWRRSFFSQNQCFRLVVQVKTLTHTRVLRGFEPRNPSVKPARDYRGVVYRQAQGFVVQIFYPEPLRSFAQVFLNPIILGAGRRSLLGYIAMGREELTGITRVSRTLWEPVAPDCAAVRAAYRRIGLVNNKDLPDSIANLILPPVT